MKRLVGITALWPALSLVSDGLTTLALPLRLAEGAPEVDTQATAIGLVTIVAILAGMAVQPVAGASSDWLRPRFGRRPFVAFGVALTVASLLAFGGAQGLPAIAASFLAVTVALNVAQAGQQAFIPDLIPADRRGRAAGLKGFADVGGAVAGFALVAAVGPSGGTPAIAIAMAVALVVAVGLTILLVDEGRVDGPAVETNDPGDDSTAPTGPPFRRGLAGIILARFLFLLGTFAVGRFLFVVVEGRLDLAPDEAVGVAGGILVALGLATAVVAPFGGWAADRIGRRPTMLAGACAAAAGTAGMAILDGLAGLVGAGLLLAVGNAVFGAASWSVATDLAPRPYAARTMGVVNIGTAGAAAAAGLAGPVVDLGNQATNGGGFVLLFAMATASIAASALVLPFIGGEAAAASTRSGSGLTTLAGEAPVEGGSP